MKHNTTYLALVITETWFVDDAVVGRSLRLADLLPLHTIILLTLDWVLSTSQLYSGEGRVFNLPLTTIFPALKASLRLKDDD